LNRYPVLAPQFLGHDETKRLAAQRVEGMNDSNPLRIDGIMGS